MRSEDTTKSLSVALPPSVLRMQRRHNPLACRHEWLSWPLPHLEMCYAEEAALLIGVVPRITKVGFPSSWWKHASSALVVSNSRQISSLTTQSKATSVDT